MHIKNIVRHPDFIWCCTTVTAYTDVLNKTAMELDGEEMMNLAGIIS